MRQKKYGALIALNAALVGVLLLVSLPSGATAQQQGAASRGRGDYTMVAGQTQGSSEDAVWIVDAANEELMALRWDISRQNFQFIAYAPFSTRDLTQPVPPTPRSR